MDGPCGTGPSRRNLRRPADLFPRRWDHWSVGIGGSDPAGDPLWYYEEPYGKPDGYDASYMPQDEAHAFILAAIERYRAEQA